ncbi:hypothetical protein PAPYR_800 [Paratrimastix pyriformis]|uniref:BAR domain-containing protein n=1 Tax=Paratrimastix pyriformis TaxID=342808 RepID=A0ABQ8UUI1_9EUKA|nr:hypothetical protein PAPYR_800 [Paratrimastix pyriformis]
MAANEQLVSGQLRARVGAVAKANAKLWDKAKVFTTVNKGQEKVVTEILTELNLYATTETEGLKQSFLQISRGFGDLLEEEKKLKSTLRTELAPMATYSAICSNMQEILKRRDSDLKTRISKERNYQEAIPKGFKKAQEAKEEWDRSVAALVGSDREMGEKMIAFERKKLVDYKNSLRSVSHAYMTFFGRGLEIMTEVYRRASAIDIDANLQETLQKLQSASPAASAAASTAAATTPVGVTTSLTTVQPITPAMAAGSPGATASSPGTTAPLPSGNATATLTAAGVATQ